LKFERTHRQGTVFLLEPHVSEVDMFVPEGAFNAHHPNGPVIAANASSSGDGDVLNRRTSKWLSCSGCKPISRYDFLSDWGPCLQFLFVFSGVIGASQQDKSKRKKPDVA
jgi:hypothetical protein